MEFTSQATSEETNRELSEEASSGLLQEKDGKQVSEQSPKLRQKPFEQFSGDLEQIGPVPEKVRFALAYMKEALSEGGGPELKNFWAAKKLAAALFKAEGLSEEERKSLWESYTALVSEAQKIKEALEEQHALQLEQVASSIDSLEKELNHLPELVAKAQEVSFGQEPKCMLERIDLYCSTQKELLILNPYALKINSLRKELMKLEVQPRKKNILFKRLSKAGDLIFPRRKELIKEVSDQFASDVSSFVREHFNGERLRKPPYFLRNEIKALQGAAKKLTLNTHAFTETRKLLSESWDRLKLVERDRKKEKSKQKFLFEQCEEEIQLKFSELEKKILEERPSLEEMERALAGFDSLLKAKRLEREALKAVQAKLSRLRKEVDEKRKSEIKELQEKKRLEEELRRSLIQSYEEEIEGLFERSQEMDLAALQEAREELLERIKGSDLRKHEAKELERRLSSIQNLIAEKRLASLTDDQLDSLNELKELLEQQQQFRLDSQNQLDSYKKASSASCLDFEQAFKLDQLIQDESDNCEKIKRGIEQIKSKIHEIEQNASLA